MIAAKIDADMELAVSQKRVTLREALHAILKPLRLAAVVDDDILLITKRKANWRIHQDHRKLLDEKDVNAVIVGTHDHGRALPCIHACQPGKDVYAEKPLTVCIAEGRALVACASTSGSSRSARSSAPWP